MGTDAKPIVLLVDDEEKILAALCRSLRREGYEILTAETPARALSLLDEYEVDLVLCDQKMPGMSGLRLLAEVARRRPSAARMLITGWSESLPEADLERLRVDRVLPKPWDDAELKSALRNALL